MMRSARGFLLLFFIPFFVLAKDIGPKDFHALKTSDPSLINAYLELMQSKKLIHQTDARLKKRQLLKETGGLCAFTAQVNAIQAVSQFFQISKGKFLKRPDYFLYEVASEARAYMEEDPLYEGIDLWDLKVYTSEVLEDHGLEEIIKLNYTDDPREIAPNKLKNYYWKIHLLGMLSEDKKEGHTVVLLKLDQKSSVIYASDPNYPNQIIKIPYKFNDKGLQLFLSEDFPGFQPALVDEMIEVNIPQDE